VENKSTKGNKRKSKLTMLSIFQQ